jgi:NitT/TauT family transport system ATP-binding protein
MMANSSVAASRPDPRALISLDRCSLAFGETEVLRDVSLEVLQGELLAVLGPSGCGKSTLLRLLLGLLPATPGGRVTRHDPDAPMGIVFQRPVLLPWLTARANVALCLCLGPKKVLSRREREGRAEHALERVGLKGFGGHYPHQLSGGMQQRVAIARALVAEPSVLLMDEPFGALDELTRAAMNLELLRLWERADTSLETVVLVTHSVTEALLMADRVIVFASRPGRVVSVFHVGFGKPRSEHFARIEATPDFQSMLRAVRSELRPS